MHKLSLKCKMIISILMKKIGNGNLDFFVKINKIFVGSPK